MENTNIPVSLLNSISIQNLWGSYNFNWPKLNRDVNILFGINGSGKTTVIDIIDFMFNLKKLTPAEKSIVTKKLNYKNCLVHINYNNNQQLKYESPNKNTHQSNFTQVFKVNNFNVLFKSKSSKNTILDYNLEHLIFKKEHEASFTFIDYRLKNLAGVNINQSQIKIYQNKINDLYNLINEYFKDTGKEIFIDEKTNGIRFFHKRTNNYISINELSSGEKQLLIIIFTLFLQDEAPSILLLDEPEISLHVSWQHQLINTMRKLNPNCQLIISTHSPSIFGKGWGSHIFRMEGMFNNG